MFEDKDLDFWIKQNVNVLFSGRAGVGKTARIIDAFKRNGLRWLYYSAPTMDPWVDFIGAPKEQIDEDGNPYLGLIRPKALYNDQIDALVFDEINRASSKVKNAVMELLQFRSINGHKFNNLKMIWAAVNPIDDPDHDYDVESLDFAQWDRFQVHVDVPYEPYKPYFESKYKQDGVRAVSWWRDLPEAIQQKVSPRRLEYALDWFRKGGDLSHILPKESGPLVLQSVLATKTLREKLQDAFDQGDKEKFKRLMSKSSDRDILFDFINTDDNTRAFGASAFNGEDLEGFVSTYQPYKAIITNLNFSDDTVCTAMHGLTPKHPQVINYIAEYSNQSIQTLHFMNRIGMYLPFIQKVSQDLVEDGDPNTVSKVLAEGDPETNIGNILTVIGNWAHGDTKSVADICAKHLEMIESTSKRGLRKASPHALFALYRVATETGLSREEFIEKYPSLGKLIVGRKNAPDWDVFKLDSL